MIRSGSFEIKGSLKFFATFEFFARPAPRDADALDARFHVRVYKDDAVAQPIQLRLVEKRRIDHDHSDGGVALKLL